MNVAKALLLAFFFVAFMRSAYVARISFQYGANRSGWESAGAAAILAGLGVLVVLA